MTSTDDNDLLQAGRLPGDPSTGATVMGEWPVVVPFTTTRALPSFPVDTLPGWLSDFVLGLAEELQVATDMVAMTALAACAAAVGGRVHLEVKPGFVVPLNLYVVVVAEPSERKSAVMSAVRAPLVAWENEEAERVRPLIASAKAEHATLEARAQKLRAQIEKSDGAKRADLERALKGVGEDLAKCPIPTLPQILCDDITPEALVNLMAQNGGRMTILTEEGGVFDQASGRYRPSGGLDPYLKGYSGDLIVVNRIGRPPERVEKPALTIGAMVQPAVIAKVVSNEEFAGRGLLARFVYAWPESRLGTRRVDPEGLDPAARAAYSVRLLALVRMVVPTGARLSLSADAMLVRLQFAERLEPRLGPLGDLAQMHGWGGKIEGTMLRICGLLHLAEHGGGAAVWEIPVADATLDRAVRIADYAVEHAKATLLKRSVDPRAAEADCLLGCLRASSKISVTERDLYQAVKGKFPTMSRLSPIVDALVEHGYLVRCAPQARGATGRPPSPTLRVNPRWIEAGRP